MLTLARNSKPKSKKNSDSVVEVEIEIDTASEHRESSLKDAIVARPQDYMNDEFETSRNDIRDSVAGMQYDIKTYIIALRKSLQADVGAVQARIHNAGVVARPDYPGLIACPKFVNSAQMPDSCYATIPNSVTALNRAPVETLDYLTRLYGLYDADVANKRQKPNWTC
ncbi:hypothetical protein M427DRAFT_30683 [Gonapodya prolifera JEL478]|uniref:Uncharacterized protein n=1 Tax=Gonapodya prolifera (strain JEL478) TaxID=1344416 RepID=A0A139AKC9_GONPJ|nr:hypothetical protein M427DRAFT_30683 [Gonapodya prolifera JEL478]|eukprot:KXS17226.1 hypothetical protein M427DRAFT_30683 [Gonapodya prolifera JEL478]